MKKLAFIILIFALESSFASQLWNIQNYSVEEGLMQPGVYALFQDTNNLLWIGTDGGGVVTYDGRLFNNYQLSNFTIGKNVRCIRSNHQKLLIGSAKEGLLEIGLEDTVHHSVETGLPSNHVRDALYYQGSLWIATFSGGLVRVGKENQEVFDITNELPSNTVRCLAVQKDRLYVGTDFGLMEFDGISWKTINVGTDFVSSLIVSIYPAEDGVYVGTQKGLFYYADGKAQLFSKNKLVQKARIKAITKTDDGTLFIGTRKGLLKVGTKSDTIITMISESRGLGDSRIRCLLNTGSNAVWTGTYFGGISLIMPSYAYLEKSNDVGVDNAYNHIWNNKSATILSSFNAGFVYQDADTSYHSFVSNGLSSDVINDVVWVNDSVYVIATEEGLNLFINHELKSVYDEYNLELKSSNFSFLEKLQDKLIGFLDDGSVAEFVYQTDSLKLSNNSKRPNAFSITDVKCYNGALWYAHAGGITKYVYGGVYLEITTNKKDIVSLFEWRAQLYGLSSDNSLLLIKDLGIQQQHHFSIKDEILWMQPFDKVLYCWINNELFRIDELFNKTIVPVSKPIAKTKFFKNASVVNGNQLMVGTVGGVFHLVLDEIPQNESVLKVTLSDVSHEFKQLEWQQWIEEEVIVFPTTIRHLTFSVQSNEVVYAEGVQYAFKLEGSDNQFINKGNSAEITYPNIQPGSYALFVKSKAPLGNWSEPQKVIAFEIKSPFYQNPWAIGTIVVVGVGIVYVVIYLRTRRLEAEKRKLEKLVNERTAELKIEKQKTDNLLLNILPAEIADELKANGAAEARGYDQVSILFTDFKGFTKISGEVSPKDLVKDLDEIFAAFDEIVDRFQLEKIKTIGDAYMCVGGIPKLNPKHAKNAILVGKAMVEFMDRFNEKKRSLGHAEWLIRVGVHSGPIVAGVVGKSKFAYDVWGDSVNVASRMESSSEPGRINISATTYELVKESFECEYRGSLEAKNKGKLDMYFVK